MTEPDTRAEEQLCLSLSQVGDTGEVSVIRCDGVLDTLTAGNLDSIIGSLVGRDRLRIVCDLGGVDYVSSAGWGVFVSHLRSVRERAGDIKLVRMAPEVREIFELLEFDGLLEHFDAVEPAVRRFGGDGNGNGSAIGVADPTVVAAAPSVEATSTSKARPARDENEAVLQMVWEDPFYSVGEMKVRLREIDEFPLGRWRIYRILRLQGLTTRRRRLRYVRRGMSDSRR